jgi:hypothetical protein
MRFIKGDLEERYVSLMNHYSRKIINYFLPICGM